MINGDDKCIIIYEEGYVTGIGKTNIKTDYPLEAQRTITMKNLFRHKLMCDK